MRDIDQFITQTLRPFLKDHNLPTDVPARAAKFIEEVQEWHIAHNLGEDHESTEEAIDCLITILAYLDAKGVKNPLHHAWLKIQAVRERAEYREMRSRGPTS